MFSGHSLLILINIVCIVFLITMLTVLAAATRMKGSAGWAAIAIFANLPVILANLVRDVAPQYYLFFIYPAYTINLLGFPALWFFTQSQLDKSFRLRRCSLLHTLPALVSLVSHSIYYAPLPAAQLEAEIALLKAGGKNLPLIINDVFLYVGFIAYFAFIIRYARKRMKYLRDHFSDSGYNAVSWMPGILIFYTCGIFIAAVVHLIHPLADTWVIPLMNMAGLAYLVYCVIFHSTTEYINRLPTQASPNPSEGGEQFSPFGGVRGGQQMQEVCDKVMHFLRTSGAYTNPDFSLSMLSVETGISSKYISRSINGYLGKNFFDLINELRIEEAKRVLRSSGEQFTIDSIVQKCGFHSRSAFFATFRKAEGKTPLQWVKTDLSL